ncbi:hypothetical protein JW805_20485 [Roseomonas aeriglobus]|nr:hypothetical protein [Roseomonas aeriglobus]
MAAANDECFILIKRSLIALANILRLCCAGVGRDRKWRRQYPVPFRILAEGRNLSDGIGYNINLQNPKKISAKKVKRLFPNRSKFQVQ